MIKIDTKVEVNITITLTEEEARALNAITIYGNTAFLKVFYEHLGKNYLQPHERGLIDLFSKIQSSLPENLKRINKVREQSAKFIE